MQVIKEFKNNELIYDNIKDELYFKKINIDKEMVTINYQDIIDTQFSGGNLNQKFQRLKDDLSLGIYEKAPCGGFLNFYKINSDRGNEFIIYSGVNEVSNSHYVLTVYKILKE